MKQWLMIGCLWIAGTVMAFAQNGDALRFDKGTHSFGKVKQNNPVTVEFSFTNVSDQPVLIEDATAECGCTKPEYPPKPIAPGKTGTIKVTYDSKTMGAFNKKITIMTYKLTSKEKHTTTLSISGEVVS